jgi:hypothetical protein
MMIPVDLPNIGESYVCTYCERSITYDSHRNRPTRDHFIPRRGKGIVEKGKAPYRVICCQWCNSRKSNLVFNSIDEVRAFIKTCTPPKNLDPMNPGNYDPKLMRESRS